MGRFLCNYFTAHPNPEGPTHPHPPTYPPPQLSTWTLDISRTLESQAGDTALGLAATKRNDISACLCGLISSRNEYSWTHEYSRRFFGSHYFNTASSWILRTFFLGSLPLAMNIHELISPIQTVDSKRTKFAKNRLLRNFAFFLA